MPIPPGESIDPERTRQRIIEVCDSVFASRGIHLAGMNEIAVATKSSKASIYKNFGSKEGLVEAVLDHRSRQAQRWIRSVAELHPPGIARILAIFDLLLSWFSSEDFAGCAVVSAAAEERVSGGVATVLARRHLAAYRGFLREELDAVGLAGAAELTTQLLVLIEGATMVSAIEQDSSIATAARSCAALLLSAGDSCPDSHQLEERMPHGHQLDSNLGSQQ